MNEHRPRGSADGAATAVLQASGMLRASEKAVVEAAIGRRPGVIEVEANPVAQNAAVIYDPTETSVAELSRWINECGMHCEGQSVPEHICDPMMEAAHAPPHETKGEPAREHEHAPPAPEEMKGTPDEVMGHGGHGEMSMAAMVRNMRNRFFVALLFSIPIVLWSPIGRDIFGFDAAVPFGLREDVWTLLLSLPVILYSCEIFFTGAVRRCAPAPST